jgi:hypothetical protein
VATLIWWAVLYAGTVFNVAVRFFSEHQALIGARGLALRRGVR